MSLSGHLSTVACWTEVLVVLYSDQVYHTALKLQVSHWGAGPLKISIT